MLVQALRRFWLLSCVVLLATLLGVGVAAAQLDTRSTVTAVVSVSPRAESNPSAALITLLTTKYVAYASSPALAQEVAGDVDVPDSEVRDGLAVTMPERTTSIRIAVTSDSASDAAAVADAISEAVVERSASDEYLAAEVVVPADAASASQRSGRTRLLLVGGAGALVLAVGAAVGAQTLTRVQAGRRERQDAAGTTGG